ncbi:hypothetical protein SAMN05660657_05067 [Geodermatophilus amargosae]|uniref:Uncharacterized protein n=1 Tax=Geodermatophilus amargosae TaxID=1296565 RepID=A0A1I7CZ64_9ACTN|nr:hypothetical protein [Geodermatophilus amargosae]SFU04704.1 hypothetical protein SAMN05660657_05067 [Geodermatophilus amargosae]
MTDRPTGPDDPTTDRSEAGRRLVRSRWDNLTAEQRREQTAAGRAAALARRHGARRDDDARPPTGPDTVPLRLMTSDRDRRLADLSGQLDAAVLDLSLLLARVSALADEVRQEVTR